MKSALLLLIFSFTSIFGVAQKANKYQTDTFRVYGNCGMCEDRIENALDIVGIRSAQWDEKTQMLTVTYISEKISIHEIHQICANIGHATEKMKADEKAYANLHHCCKYIIHNHEENQNH